MEEADRVFDDYDGCVGECFFWYRLTRVVPDKIQRAVKQLCVCVCVCLLFAIHTHSRVIYQRKRSFLLTRLLFFLFCCMAQKPGPSPPHHSTRMLPAEMSLHHLAHPLVREAHQHQRSGECMPTISRNYTQVSIAVGGACGADARQLATRTAPVQPTVVWRQTGKWTKTALQGHHLIYVPVRDKLSMSVADALVRHVYLVMKWLVTLLDIQPRKIPSHRPNYNGVVEQVHLSLHSMFAKLVSEHQRD